MIKATISESLNILLYDIKGKDRERGSFIEETCVCIKGQSLCTESRIMQSTQRSAISAVEACRAWWEDPDESCSSLLSLLNDLASDTKPASAGESSARNYGQRTSQMETKKRWSPCLLSCIHYDVSLCANSDKTANISNCCRRRQWLFYNCCHVYGWM